MRIISLDSVDSTNIYLEKDVETFENFTFVSTSFQTKGRGRENRVWSAEKGKNLLFSLLIKDQELLKRFSSISILTATVVLKALEKYEINGLSIKWPNDVYVNDKKICGILLTGKLPEYLIVGVGINLNQKVFSGEYRTTPTSYVLETGKEIDIGDFKNTLFNCLIEELQALKKNISCYKKVFESNNYLLGKNRLATINNEEVEAKVLGINDDDSLLVSYKGKTYSIFSGEIQ